MVQAGRQTQSRQEEGKGGGIAPSRGVEGQARGVFYPFQVKPVLGKSCSWWVIRLPRGKK
jgi:hypothetical protein